MVSTTPAYAEDPLWLEALPSDAPITYGARQDRLLVSSAFPGVGVLTNLAWAVTQRAAGANLSVDVALGAGVIPGTSIANQGSYLVRTTSSVNLTISAPPTTGTRIDLVVAQISDPGADGGTVYAFNLVVVTGVGTAGAVPATPPNSLLLAQVTVAYNASSIVNAAIADKRVPAQGLGDNGFWYGSRTTVPSFATNAAWVPVGLFVATVQSIGIVPDSSGTNFTVLSYGQYQVSGCMTYSSEASPVGLRAVRLYMGAGGLIHEFSSRPDATYNTALQFFGCANMNAGDTIHIETYQSQGRGTTFSVGPGQFHIEINRL